MNFKPGDKARLIQYGHKMAMNPVSWPYIGTEVTVLSPLQPLRQLAGGVGYHIRTHDGMDFACIPECLERPKPPHEKKVAWEVVPGWRAITAPKKAPVEVVARGWLLPTAALR
jgi:hypothetical protein